MAERRKTRPRRNADRASECFAVAAISSEDTPSTLLMQARRLAARYGVSPALAPIVATLHFGEVRS